MQDAERESGQPLSNLLIKPVQRLCKYPLLFRELLKSLASDDTSYPAVSKASGIVEEMVHAVNERVREVEGMAALRTLAESLNQPEILTPARCLLLSVDGVGSIEGVRSPSVHTLYIYATIMSYSPERSRGRRHGIRSVSNAMVPHHLLPL